MEVLYEHDYYYYVIASAPCSPSNNNSLRHRYLDGVEYRRNYRRINKIWSQKIRLQEERINSLFYFKIR